MRDPAEDRRARLLVAEDDVKLGRRIVRVLEPDHDVVVVTNGREALDPIVGGERFDLVLCDLRLPGVTGMDLYERLHTIAPELVGCMVFMTAGACTPEAAAFLGRPGIARLDKPFRLDELRRTVREHLARRSSSGGGEDRG